MIDATMNDKEFDLRIEVVGKLVLIFATPSDKRALILTPDECVKLSKTLIEAAEQAKD